ncbi:MAG TPA: ATP synthase F1 subunit epsilon, partial [Anaerolineales bacterium]|nr:ATP synthase F1 subunit epsilon [Anaerolineales bacterium]
VILPGVAGEMGILPNHAPVLTILKYGVIKVRQGSKEELFAVAGGMAEVQPKIVTILADAAENIMDIDITRAQAAKKRAEDALAKIKPDDQDTYLRMEAALRRSNLRLDVARRYRRVKDVFTDKDASM